MSHDLVVELVSPTMIGGSKARQCDDPPRLRPPSLRGHLRFWARALGGSKLEEELFGDLERGQRAQIIFARAVGEGGNLPTPEQALLIPSRNARTDMIPPGGRVHVRFRIPSEVALSELRAVVWTWLHLGSVGRRSRRGYGSLQWIPSKDDLLADWPPLWKSEHLENRESLEDYLRIGLRMVAGTLGAPLNGARGPDHSRLVTCDQVFVGARIDAVWDIEGGTGALEQRLHGLNEEGRGGTQEADQLGHANNSRLPSPMMWRVFPVPGGGYRPVMTWFPYGYPAGSNPRIPSVSELADYLRTLGFDESLERRSLFV